MNFKKIFFGGLVAVMIALTVMGGAFAEDEEDQINIGKINKSNEYAKIEFKENIISDQSKFILQSSIDITKNMISVDSFTYPELNKPAKLTFYTDCMKNPTIYLNGVIQTDKNLLLKSKLGKYCEYFIEVDHFSTWSIFDNTWNGTFYNTALYDHILGLSPWAYLSMDFNTNNSPIVYDGSKYNNNGTELTPSAIYWNSTGGIDGTGTYRFKSATGSGINLPAVTIPGRYTNSSNLTISVWIKPTNITGIKRIYSKFGGGGTVSGSYLLDIPSGIGIVRFIYANTTNNFQIAASPAGTLTVNEWQHIYVSFSDGNVAVKKNCNLVASLPPETREAFIPNYDLDSKIATDGSGLSNFNGEIDKVIIFDQFVPCEDFLASNVTTFIYQEYGNYTSEIYNSSDYDAVKFSNVWQSSIFGSPPPLENITTYGRAGNCSNITSYPYFAGIKNGLNYTYSGTNGLCFQYVIVFEGNNSYTDLLSNVTIYSFKIFNPNASLLNITRPLAYVSTTISGNATFTSNTTEEGYIVFKWYNNGILNKTDIKSGLHNGTLANTTLGLGYTRGKLIYFTATPYLNTSFGIAEGQTVYSEDLTISNTNFTLINFFPSNASSINLVKPNIFPFSVILNDTDGDVNVTWSVGAVMKGNLTNFNFSSNDYPLGINNLIVYATDGVVNASVLWQVNVITSVGLSDVEKTLLGAVIIIALVLCMLTAFTDMKFKTIIKFIIGALILVAGLVFLNASGVV